ncbi:hypothetical protein AGLY_016951 [Aphis glycines]|uniref:DUF659 domain-containing protein n=1 Tax=Aphis glycines TaxID=307491 RepID=A0A6G0SWA0_APHGL|nr:hypothetical protein AGLY_016951 [Aphis glycines]
MCNVKVTAEKRFAVQQHLSRDKHINGLERNVPNRSEYFLDLTRTFLSCNIPLNKLENPAFSKFLEKYTNKQTPDRSILRKNYVSICYDETIQMIRSYVENKKLWVSINETTDANGRYVANVIIEVLEKTNHSTIAKVLDKSLSILWPQGIIHDNVLLFLSDAAPYMVKAATSIQTYYSKMIHVTCLAHALHRVAEEIKIHFPNVDELINNVKKVFLKAPSRIQIFKTMAPDIPLPPRPVLTRWGTWLNASMYYCDHFELIKEIINQLDGEDAVAVSKAQNLFSNHISNIYNSIRNFRTEIQKTPNQIGKIIYQKLSTTLNKNKGFKIISNISDILNGQGTTNEIPDDLTANDLAFFKYSPITSVDVERSFSIYKNLLADNRRSFLFENLKQALVVQCNSSECTVEYKCYTQLKMRSLPGGDQFSSGDG